MAKVILLNIDHMSFSLLVCSTIEVPDGSAMTTESEKVYIPKDCHNSVHPGIHLLKHIFFIDKSKVRPRDLNLVENRPSSIGNDINNSNDGDNNHNLNQHVIVDDMGHTYSFEAYAARQELLRGFEKQLERQRGGGRPNTETGNPLCICRSATGKGRESPEGTQATLDDFVALMRRYSLASTAQDYVQARETGKHARDETGIETEKAKVPGYMLESLRAKLLFQDALRSGNRRTVLTSKNRDENDKDRNIEQVAMDIAERNGANIAESKSKETAMSKRQWYYGRFRYFDDLASQLVG